ncbi:hypothetical protein [Abyssisolibacter fermentans]|uniref:hypothetical protein n=1 Tax=Abyssisolibacter fermentans TaxID=1766203 RepID=UPI000830AB17|nr:hypothetical protein [Abyssisolibacter fermentans]
MENSVKAIIIGASIAITMVIVSVGFYILRQGQDAARNTSEKISNMNTQIAESDYTMYDGLDISGSEVVNVLNKFKNQYIGIRVETGKKSTGTWYIYDVTIDDDTANVGKKSTNKISNVIDETKNEYINPNGRFTGKVYRDENGAISALEFIQNTK